MRFQKWQFPNLEAFAAHQDGLGHSDIVVENASSDEHYFATSKLQSLVQNTSGVDESSGKGPLGRPDNDSHIQASSRISDSELDMLEGVSSELAGATSKALKLAMTVTEYPSNGTRGKKATPHFESLPATNFPVKAADGLIAAGADPQAYGVYSKHWDSMWSGHKDATALPSMISHLSTMSRAASTSLEILQVVKNMKQLIDAYDKRVSSDPRGFVILHTQVANLLLCLQQSGDAAHHLDTALWLMEVWLKSAGPWFEDWQVPANLVYHCALQGPQEFYQLVGDKLWMRCRYGDRYHWLKLVLPYEAALRDLFAYCAEMLLIPNVSLHLSKRLNPASTQDCGPRIIAGALSEWLFQQSWEPAFEVALHHASEQDRAPSVHQWVGDICDRMKISRTDLFATMALVLMNLVSPWNDACEVGGAKSTKISVSPIRPIPKLVLRINEAAMALVTRSTLLPGSEFLKSFLTARAIIGLTGVAKHWQAVPNGPKNSSKTKVHNKENPRSSHESQGLGGTAVRVSNDPTFTKTPTSSTSSGFRSMLSLNRRIMNGKMGSSVTSEDLTLHDPPFDSIVE